MQTPPRLAAPRVRLTASLRNFPIRREAIRAVTAFVLYLSLRWLWGASGLKSLHESAVLALAVRILTTAQHFPALAGIAGASLRNLDFLVVLTIALALVSTGIRWPRRLGLFGAALCVILAVDVTAVLLQAKVMASQELWSRERILILLPWEFWIVERTKYLLYDFGLQIGPFVMFALTAFWNSRPLPAPRSRSSGRTQERRATRWGRLRGPARAAIVVGVLSLPFGIAMAWHIVREADPRHVAAHARIGQLFFVQHDTARAEQQYRAAVAGGTADPAVYYNLAAIVVKQGRQDEAVRLLRRCSEVADPTVWSERIDRAFRQMNSRGS